jgi:hypothetical protein
LEDTTYKSHKTPDIAVLIHHALILLVNEWKEWFLVEANKDISAHADYLSTQERNPRRGLADQMVVECRRAALDEFKELSHPFCVSPRADMGSYLFRAAMRADQIDRQTVKLIEEIPLKEFCGLLLRAATLRTVAPPLPPTGCFAMVWRWLIPYTKNLLATRYETNQRDRAGAKVPPEWEAVFQYAMSKVLQNLNLDVIPWYTESADGRTRKLDIHKWRIINSTQASVSKRKLEHLYSASDRATDEFTREMQRSTPSSHWSISDVKVDDMKRFWIKTRKPHEFCMENSPFEEDPKRPGFVKGTGQKRIPCKGDPEYYVYETYTWALEFLDLSNNIHKMILFLSILFSKACPKISKPAKCLTDGERNIGEWTTLVRRTPWVTTTKRGVKDRPKVFAQMLTFALAILNAGSPLRRYMVTNGDVLGKEWTTRHSKHFHKRIACHHIVFSSCYR